MFKFNIGQQVWYMYDNRMHTAPIGARMVCEVDESFAKTRAGNSWNPRILYATIHGQWREEQLFSSALALTNFLDNNTVHGTMTGTKA